LNKLSNKNPSPDFILKMILNQLWVVILDRGNGIGSALGAARGLLRVKGGHNDPDLYFLGYVINKLLNEYDDALDNIANLCALDKKFYKKINYTSICKNCRKEILPTQKQEVDIVKKMFKVYGDKKTTRQF